jgi:serine/threonine-protein phosphatase 4 catalytic subunit
MGDLNIDNLIENIRKLKLPTENEVRELCQKATEILIKLDNVAHLSCPITICGDIHGQIEDLMELFFVGGDVPETNYIFMGDFVDRGRNSVETFIFLLAMQVKYPERITLLRGNHESRQITQAYGFYDECKRKYNGTTNVWKYCTDVFDLLQLSAVIENQVFCVHGGLSPSAPYIDDIKKINRKQEVPHDGIMSDILWGDPDEDVKGYGISPRGAGYLFGGEEVAKFCQLNKIQLIARAHQLAQEGYKFYFNNQLVTVWSAPNYCYICGNVASVMEFDEHMNRSIKIFEAAPEEVRRQQERKPVLDYFL